MNKLHSIALDNAFVSQFGHYRLFSEAQALRFPEYQISWVSDCVIDRVRDFTPWARSAMEVANEAKFGTKVA